MVDIHAAGTVKYDRQLKDRLLALISDAYGRMATNRNRSYRSHQSKLVKKWLEDLTSLAEKHGGILEFALAAILLLSFHSVSNAQKPTKLNMPDVPECHQIDVRDDAAFEKCYQALEAKLDKMEHDPMMWIAGTAGGLIRDKNSYSESSSCPSPSTRYSYLPRFTQLGKRPTFRSRRTYFSR